MLPTINMQDYLLDCTTDSNLLIHNDNSSSLTSIDNATQSSLSSSSTKSYSYHANGKTFKINHGSVESIDKEKLIELSENANDKTHTKISSYNDSELDKEEEFLKKCLFDEMDYKNLINDLKYNYKRDSMGQNATINSASEIDFNFDSLKAEDSKEMEALLLRTNQVHNIY